MEERLGEMRKGRIERMRTLFLKSLGIEANKLLTN